MLRTAALTSARAARSVGTRSTIAVAASVDGSMSQCCIVPAAAAHSTLIRRTFSSDSSSANASTYSAAAHNSSGNTAASAAAQEARIAQLRAELDAVKKKKSGNLMTNTVGAVALGELMAAFCVVSLTGAWAWYCVDWTKLSEKKDRTIAEVTQRWNQRGASSGANAAASAPPPSAANAAAAAPSAPAPPATR